jgi:allophanate hydrolase
MARGTPGAAIVGEVWALPTQSIGALLAQVPAPLGFGQVALDDGPWGDGTCLGFLAESQGLEGTQDITVHGGWRAWLAARQT